MTDPLRELTAWLIDYQAATTVLLLILGIVRVSLRQPAQRMALAWATVSSMFLLMVLCVATAWPRVTLRPAIVATRIPDALIVPAVDRPQPDQPRANRTRLGTPMRLSPAQPAAPIPTMASVPVITASPTFQWPDGEILLAMGFLSGAMFVITWEGVGLIQIRRLRASGIQAPDFAHQELSSLVASSSRPPRLLVSSQISAAVALGVWHPAIVLPMDAIGPDERSRLRSLLAHEWAHIRRGDLWLLAATRLLFIVLYANPLYWWLRHQIRVDQELLADATAAAACGHQTYAESLVIWARRLPRPRPRMAGVIGLWESPSQLSRRIAMLLDERMSVTTRTSRRWQLGTGLTTLVLVTALSLVTLRPGPLVRAAEPPPVAAASEPHTNPDEVGPTTSKAATDTAPKTDPLVVVGTCLDDAGQPLSDVRLLLVFMNYDDGEQLDLQEARSSAQGQFQFAPIDARKLFATTEMHRYQQSVRRLILIAQAKGKASNCRLITKGDSIADLELMRPAEPVAVRSSYQLVSGRTSLNVTLQPARTLRGRVVDAQYRPIPGVSVAVNQNTYRVIPGFMNAVTDSDGRYEITDVEAWDREAEEKASRLPRKLVAPGEERVSRDLIEEWEFKRYTHGRGVVRHPDLPLRGFTFAKVPGTSNITLPRPAKLEGRVTFQDSSKPAAKATVEVIRNPSGDDNHWREVFETDADGRYSVATKLLPGTYEIKARLTGWPQVVSSGLQLKAGPNTADIKLQAGATIQGRVIEVSTGKPVPFVPGSISMVMAGNLATRTESDYATLGPDGKFSLTVLPGGTLISVRSLGNQIPFDGMRWMLVGNNRQAVQVVHVAKGETKDLELRLLRAATTDGDLMDHMDDEQEQSAQIQQLLNTEAGNASPKKTSYNLAEQAAVAALKQLGGLVKTETIDGRECVVEVNMVEPEVPGEAVDEQLFTDEALYYLPKLPRLKSLELTRGQSSDQGLEHLRGMAHLEAVCLLHAWGITDKSIAHVATLPKLTRFCTMGAEQLTDDSLRHLGRAANVQSLLLDGGRFTDTGLMHLKGLQHLSGLHLVCAEKRITDQGLGELAGHVELETLSLHNTQITDAGLQHLHGLKNLQQLDLPGSSVTPAGLNELKKVLPKLKSPEKQNAAGNGTYIKPD